MWRVDGADAVDDPTLTDSLLDVLGDVRDGEAAGGAQLVLDLERLHCTDILSVAATLGRTEPSVTLNRAGP